MIPGPSLDSPFCPHHPHEVTSGVTICPQSPPCDEVFTRSGEWLGCPERPDGLGWRFRVGPEVVVVSSWYVESRTRQEEQAKSRGKRDTGSHQERDQEGVSAHSPEPDFNLVRYLVLQGFSVDRPRSEL